MNWFENLLITPFYLIILFILNEVKNLDCIQGILR